MGRGHVLHAGLIMTDTGLQPARDMTMITIPPCVVCVARGEVGVLRE